MKEKQFDIAAVSDLKLIADEVTQVLLARGGGVVALVGDLGAGKTTFVQVLGRELGVVDVITSPTFTIMKQYPTTDPVLLQLIHFDLYRIEDQTELGPLQIGELLQQPKTVVCVEWPERAPALFGDGVVWLEFVIGVDEVRHVTLRVPE